MHVDEAIATIVVEVLQGTLRLAVVTSVDGVTFVEDGETFAGRVEEMVLDIVGFLQVIDEQPTVVSVLASYRAIVAE